jgi:predicted ABC-type ATPase
VTARRAPRVRAFAGPNGSGKTTLVRKLQATNLPLYDVINADDIELTLSTGTGFDASSFGPNVTKAEFSKYVRQTTYSTGAKAAALKICFDGRTMYTTPSPKGSYNAALVSGFLRDRLVKMRKSFSFESVFSHTSKLDELRAAEKRGFRVYLYYIATEAPELAIGRVKERVAGGGHGVPLDKIQPRYEASLLNLLPALKIAYRAYIFDNSGSESSLVAEKTPHGNLKLVRDRMPIWFATHVIEPLSQG